MRVYPKSKAIDSFREKMYNASDKVNQTISLYEAMKIFDEYLDDLESDEAQTWEKLEKVYAKSDVVAILTEIEEAVEMGEGYDYDRWRDRLEEVFSIYPSHEDLSIELNKYKKLYAACQVKKQ